MNAKSIIAAVGFVAALASICALAVAITQLAQSINVKSESDKAQSTMLANFATSASIQATQESNQRIANANLATQAVIQDKQLSVQKEIATAQGQGPKSAAPTATAIAQTVAELAKTNDTLEAQRRLLQLTQTAIARSTETSTSTKVPPALQPTSTTPPRVIPPTLAAPTQPITQGDGTFQEHRIIAVGTGPFTQVTISDGRTSYDDSWLATYRYRIQRIRREEQPTGCDTSVFEANKIWFSGSVGTSFTVNGQEIGKLSVGGGKHGFVFTWAIKPGDNLCAVGYDQGGFHIIFGPDIYYHYDSYCHRGYC